MAHVPADMTANWKLRPLPRTEHDGWRGYVCFQKERDDAHRRRELIRDWLPCVLILTLALRCHLHPAHRACMLPLGRPLILCLLVLLPRAGRLSTFFPWTFLILGDSSRLSPLSVLEPGNADSHRCDSLGWVYRIWIRAWRDWAAANAYLMCKMHISFRFISGRVRSTRRTRPRYFHFSFFIHSPHSTLVRRLCSSSSN